MFDGSLQEIGDLPGLEDAALIDAVRGWARAENAACARKQAVMAELFARRTGLDADERELWWVDPEAAVTAELAAAQHISRGLALHQTHRGVALRDRLPKVAALFEARLITDPVAMAAVDAELAAQITGWGALSTAKTEHAIDALVDAHDPGALRRSRQTCNRREVQFGSPTDQAGFTCLWGRLYAPDAVLLERRVNEIAHSVCEQDPRTSGERSADAMIALAAGHDELACACDDPDCAAARREATPPVTAVVHVVAHAETLAAASTSSQCSAPPAFVIGGGIMPAPLLSAMLERATVREIRHPGDAPPEPGYMPSPALAEFVRCRDLTCRWPGCDRSAYECDLDHTIPYPVGPTHASNLKCYCRFHRVHKRLRQAK